MSRTIQKSRDFSGNFENIFSWYVDKAGAELAFAGTNFKIIARLQSVFEPANMFDRPLPPGGDFGGTPKSTGGTPVPPVVNKEFAPKATSPELLRGWLVSVC